MIVTSVAGRRMLRYLPSFLYERSDLFREIMQSSGQEYDTVDLTLMDIFDQRFVNRATWSIKDWEQELGIPADETLDEQTRRENIRAKARSYGTVTTQMLKTVAEAYDGGTIDVIQSPADSQVTIRFVDTRGTPASLPYIQSAIAEVIPAHIEVVYEFRWARYSELATKTHNYLAGLTYDQLKVTAF